MREYAGSIGFTTTYAFLLLVLGVVLLSVINGVEIIRQTEAAVGHSLSCSEAYERREINHYFYPNRQLQGDSIYLYSLFAPIILICFAGMIFAVGVIKYPDKFSHIRWPLVGAGVILLAALLAYSPIIYTSACATD